jgi:hypothetical protein
MYTLEQLQQKNLAELKEIGSQLDVLPAGDRRCRQSWIDALVPPPLLQLLEDSPAASVEPVQEPIEVQAQEAPIESKFGRIVYPRPAKEAIAQEAEKSLDVDRTQEPIVQAAETAPGVEVDRAQEPIMETVEASPGVDPVDDEWPGCCNCFGDGYVEDEFGLIKFCQCETDPILSHQRTQRAIALAAKISLKPKSDRNPILTGIPLSDRFLARYSPPQSETLHYELTDGYKVDTDGQLSLFEVQVVTEPEPPDPDDFESLNAFREAIARWDWEHPSSSDHCSDLPNSVHSEPNSVHSEPNSVHSEPNSVDSDPLEVSLDSFCEWAPCPADWYEPPIEQSKVKVMELSPVHNNSSTSDFFILTFDCWGDRFNRSDEPPDTGIFARLPKPKPPKFPPQSASKPQVDKTSRNYPETIPKLFQRIAAGSSTQPARSPPGGDAMS